MVVKMVGRSLVARCVRFFSGVHRFDFAIRGIIRERFQKSGCERPGRLELPTLCLEAVRTTLPNLARGVANRTKSASWGNFLQTTFSSFCCHLPQNCRCFPRFA